MKLNFQKAKYQQIIFIFLVLIFPCYYDYQMIYSVAKPAAGILLLAHLWINVSSIFFVNLLFRFGGDTQQKRDAIFYWYFFFVMTGVFIYILSIPAFFSNPMGCITFVVVVYIIAEMLIDNIQHLVKNFKAITQSKNQYSALQEVLEH